MQCKMPDEIMRRRIIPTKAAAEFLGFSVPHFRRLYRTNRVPQPLLIGARKLGWRLGDLLDFVEAKVSSSAKGGRNA
jgi:predicted DNA-binding transcriptional regulator AlpA